MPKSFKPGAYMTRKANTSRRDRLRPFREVLGLTTSPADLKTFSRVRKILRYLVSCHYDFHLTNRGQADSTRSLFMLDVFGNFPKLFTSLQARMEMSIYVSGYFANASWNFRDQAKKRLVDISRA